MTAETKYFGEIEYQPEEVLHFPDGIFGFEDERQYLLLPFEGNGTLFSLQSVRTPYLTFVLIDPFSLLESYAPVLQPDELRAMGVEKSEDLFYYTMCSVTTPVGDSTVNLKCPIAINGDTGRAMQVILESGPYHMRHRLSDFQDEQEDLDSEGASC